MTFQETMTNKTQHSLKLSDLQYLKCDLQPCCCFISIVFDLPDSEFLLDIVLSNI